MKRRSWAVPAYVCAFASVIGLTFFAACTADDDDDSGATGDLQSDGAPLANDCTSAGFACRDFYACQPDAGHIVGFTNAAFACTTPDYVCCSVGPSSCGGEETYSCEAPDGAISRPLCDVNVLRCPTGSTPIGPIVLGGSDAGDDDGGDGGGAIDAGCSGDSGAACIVPCADDRGTCTAATACGAGLPDDGDASATCGLAQICCTHACSNEVCRTALGVTTSALACDSATGTLVCPVGSTPFKPDAGSGIADAGRDASDASR